MEEHRIAGVRITPSLSVYADTFLWQRLLTVGKVTWLGGWCVSAYEPVKLFASGRACAPCDAGVAMVSASPETGLYLFLYLFFGICCSGIDAPEFRLIL